MPWYQTAYEPWPVEAARTADRSGKYFTYVWAYSLEHAEAIIARRRIGEVIVDIYQEKATPRPFPAASELIRKTKTATQKINFLHGVLFLSFLVATSTGQPPHMLMGDLGLMHDSLHYTLGIVRRKDMLASIRHFERLVPGYLPKDEYKEPSSTR